ncbi:hypothetical protein HYY71_03195 [Candidatus Woesearchaeota archaeon]|nr:hypothetical protein [Candidatus Woesearchaeota archaeon]
MAFLDGLGQALSAVPNQLWAVVHLVTALVAFWFAYKSKGNQQWMWAFVLYGVTGVLYTFVHFGQVNNYATHILESVLVFVAFILIGMSAMKK